MFKRKICSLIPAEPFGPPPYNSDLTLSDYHWFLRLKEDRLNWLNADNQAKEMVVQFLKGLVEGVTDMGLQKVDHSMEKCLDGNSDYVEEKRQF